MSKKGVTQMQAQYFSLIVKKRRTSITSTKQPTISPSDNWLVSKKVNRHQKGALSVSGKSYKSQITGYREIYKTPLPEIW